ncbi:hypothetical protein NN561_012779 [Cricetulus griseus]
MLTPGSVEKEPCLPLRHKKAVPPRGVGGPRLVPAWSWPWEPRGGGSRVEPRREPKDSGLPLQKLCAAGPSMPRCLPVQRTLLLTRCPDTGANLSVDRTDASQRRGMLGSSSGTPKAPEPPTGICRGGSPSAGPTASFLPLSRAES